MAFQGRLLKDRENRKFLLLRYDCPDTFGNKMHKFAHDLITAIILNRTVLWKYNTWLNNLSECDEMLTRAPWIASYDEIGPLLELPGFGKNRNKTEFFNVNSFTAYDGKKGKALPPNHETKELMEVSWQTEPRDFTFPEIFNLLPDDWARNKTTQLFSFGVSFLYGALFRTSFDFSVSVIKSINLWDSKMDAPYPPNTKTNNSTRLYTAAIHSRTVNNDQCKLSMRERRCIESILSGKQGFCKVWILSDRPCKLDSFSMYLQNKMNCTVEVAPHDPGTSRFAENGPFAGRGFLQDMAFATHGAAHAFMGTKTDSKISHTSLRSSSSMILELIDYKNKMDAWRQGLNPSGYVTKSPLLNVCTF